jgi:RNA polymerase sigma-70 factor, ECF subfamily
MNELAAPFAGRVVRHTGLEREFEERLAEAATLAVRVAYGVLHTREDAEDVAQEAAVRAYRSFGSLRNRDSFRAWLVRTTWRLALDRRRTQRRRAAREQAAYAARPLPRTVEEVAAGRQAQERVWGALEALPEKLRIVVVLAAIEGHGMREVAALLRVPEGTVKTRLHRARRKLQEILDE